MKQISYTSEDESLIYPQVCIGPGRAYIASMLGRFQSNLGWTTIKKVIKYLQRTKSFMLTYNSNNDLNIVGYIGSNFLGNLVVMILILLGTLIQILWVT